MGIFQILFVAAASFQFGSNKHYIVTIDHINLLLPYHAIGDWWSPTTKTIFMNVKLKNLFISLSGLV